ncbi:hypothetical protein Bbelb_037850 [Branchiostoma belcheri]|nr:hypothetical protein Bbelb_037850 [Branchiostoma belcheri]
MALSSRSRGAHRCIAVIGALTTMISAGSTLLATRTQCVWSGLSNLSWRDSPDRSWDTGKLRHSVCLFLSTLLALSLQLLAAFCLSSHYANLDCVSPATAVSRELFPAGGTTGKDHLYRTTVTMSSLQDVFLSWNAIDVAQTAFEVPAIKKELVKFVLKEIDRECSLICFDGIGSEISLITENQNLRERLREPAPLLLSVLDTTVTAIMKHPSNDKENCDISKTKTVRKEAATIESTKNLFQNKACIRSTGFNYSIFPKTTTLQDVFQHRYETATLRNSLTP